MANDLDPQTKALRRIGALNSGDLDINRKGYLSPIQRRKPIVIIVLWMGVAVFEIVVLVALLLYELSLHQNPFVSLITFAILTFCSILSMLHKIKYMLLYC